MNKNEIKKVLYKEKPIATLIQIESAGSIFKNNETSEYLDNFFPIMDFYSLEDKDTLKLAYIRTTNAYYEVDSDNSILVSIELHANAVAKYECETTLGKIVFEIPLNDIGTTDFTFEMDAKLLIRWIKLDSE